MAGHWGSRLYSGLSPHIGDMHLCSLHLFFMFSEHFSPFFGVSYHPPHVLDTATVEAVQRQHTVRQRRRALMLHSAGADVQEILLTLTETGDRREYDVAVTALNTYFVPKVNNALARQGFFGINPAGREKRYSNLQQG